LPENSKETKLDTVSQKISTSPSTMMKFGPVLLMPAGTVSMFSTNRDEDYARQYQEQGASAEFQAADEHSNAPQEPKPSLGKRFRTFLWNGIMKSEWGLSPSGEARMTSTIITHNKAEKMKYAVVRTKGGFPANRRIGIFLDAKNLKVLQNNNQVLAPGSWAATNAPDIKYLYGWNLAHVNGVKLNNIEDYDNFMQTCEPGTFMFFTFRQPFDMENFEKQDEIRRNKPHVGLGLHHYH
jgi:hypothetical protein